MSDKTKVIFRQTKDDGEIIAVFPSLAGDCNPRATCLSYMHVGQHGAITTDWAEWTIPASQEKYADLMTELESVGYNLQACKRASKKDLRARIAQCKRS
jgi:hypothetical protein